MPQITFYRQARIDGGTRMGVEVDGETVLGRFDELGRDDDPVLAWFLVVECRGDDLPTDGEAARNWLLAHGDELRPALANLADAMAAGIDFDLWPMRRTLLEPTAHRPFSAEVTCAAFRRGDGQRIAAQLADLSDHWDEYLTRLGQLQGATL